MSRSEDNGLRDPKRMAAALRTMARRWRVRARLFPASPDAAEMLEAAARAEAWAAELDREPEPARQLVPDC